jgi:hypothetical protein
MIYNVWLLSGVSVTALLNVFLVCVLFREQHRVRSRLYALEERMQTYDGGYRRVELPFSVDRSEDAMRALHTAITRSRERELLRFSGDSNPPIGRVVDSGKVETHDC